MSCDCTLTTIPTLLDVTCPEGGGQIGKIAFQKINQPFTLITDEAEWTTKIAANDDTKIGLSPELDNALMPTGEPLTKGGGDNSTFRGAVRFIGDGPQTFTAELPDCPTANVVELRKLICMNQIGVYLLTDDGIWSKADSSALKIESNYTSSRGFEGNGENDKNILTFSIAGNWQENALYSPTTFTPTDLLNA